MSRGTSIPEAHFLGPTLKLLSSEMMQDLIVEADTVMQEQSPRDEKQTFGLGRERFSRWQEMDWCWAPKEWLNQSCSNLGAKRHREI